VHFSGNRCGNITPQRDWTLNIEIMADLQQGIWYLCQDELPASRVVILTHRRGPVNEGQWEPILARPALVQRVAQREERYQ
jgi:hypothetical protein